MIQTHPSPCYPVCYISQKNKIQRLKGVFYIVVLLLNERNILEGVQIIIIIESWLQQLWTYVFPTLLYIPRDGVALIENILLFRGEWINMLLISITIPEIGTLIRVHFNKHELTRYSQCCHTTYANQVIKQALVPNLYFWSNGTFLIYSCSQHVLCRQTPRF